MELEKVFRWYVSFCGLRTFRFSFCTFRFVCVARFVLWIIDGEVWPVAETMFDTDNACLGVVKPRYADCEPLRKMV